MGKVEMMTTATELLIMSRAMQAAIAQDGENAQRKKLNSLLFKKADSESARMLKLTPQDLEAVAVSMQFRLDELKSSQEMSEDRKKRLIEDTENLERKLWIAVFDTKIPKNRFDQ